MHEVKALSTPPLVLGEGALWHPGIQRLLFVDILGQTIYVQNTDMQGFQPIKANEPAGFVVPCGSQGIVAGIRDTLVKIDLSTGEQQELVCLHLPAQFRFNDGKCDPQGRLWAGVMVTADEARTPGSGALWRIIQGQAKVAVPSMSIPNGMAWSADGSLFYHTETLSGLIEAYTIQPDGNITNRHTVVDLRTEAGMPDGLCIDREGMLWVAMWGGFQVLRCDPRSGQVHFRLPLPDRYVSCCTFGGQDLRTLYITTAADGVAPGGVYSWQAPVAGTLSNEYRC
ncbi:MAG: SMP-30/gluconolactonase/LRE family protein [Clostridiales bacterium]|nr:SMP-30/gluconolactonase/LRE family protein [Clostridiales bacterium]